MFSYEMRGLLKVKCREKSKKNPVDKCKRAHFGDPLNFVDFS